MFPVTPDPGFIVCLLVLVIILFLAVVALKVIINILL
jgi:hypothetical protein